MRYDNKIQEFAEKLIDKVFGYIYDVPCWLKRTIILTFPISLPIYCVFAFGSILIYLVLRFISAIIELWKCDNKC